MDDLKFKEKLALKMLINNNSLDSGSIVVGNDIINKISFGILINNKELVKNIILKSIEKGTLEYRMWRLIEGDIIKSSKVEQYWRSLKTEVAYEYMMDNPEKAHYLHTGFKYIPETFDKVIKDKVDKGEMTKEQIDVMFEHFLNSPPPYTAGARWLAKTIFALKKNNQEELVLYAVEKLKLILENKINNSQTLSDEEKEIVKKATNQNIIRYLRGGVDDDTLEIICKDCISHDEYNDSVSFARTGTTDISGLTLIQMNNINVKNVKQIIDLAKQKFPDAELYNNVFYKMYLVIGKQRSMELIEGKYGEVSLSQIESMFESVHTDEYQIPQMNAEPIYNTHQTALINFLFASGANDINANMKKILSGEISPESLPFARMVNEWRLHYEFLGGNVVLSDLIKQLDSLSIVLPPNKKEIGPIIKEVGIEHLGKIIDVYEKMQKRTSSTIPKVKGTAGKYEYEMLDLTDTTQMIVGNITTCCFAFGEHAEKSLIYSCTNPDNRIFVIKENGKIVAQSWVWRNGNTVCFDNIEIKGVAQNAGIKFWHVYEEASKEIIKISEQSENNKEKIQLVTVGEGCSKIELKGEPLQCEKIPLCRNKSIYTDARTQVIAATSKDYEKPLEYDVEAIYQDERKKVIIVDPQQSSQDSIDKLNEHIDKINYSIEQVDSKEFKYCNSREDYTFVMYGADWFVGITVDGSIVKREYSFDERSKEEIANALQLISEKIKSGELNNNINDVMLDSMIKESATYGK